MAIRIYQSCSLNINAEITLDERATQHLVHVLRLKPNTEFILFNGDGNNYRALLVQQAKKQFCARILDIQPGIAESACLITLGQAISRGEKMDFAVQKAVELGVYAIQPLITEHIAVKLSAEHLVKKQSHWQAIAISACEQSGRCHVPQVYAPIILSKWLTECEQDLRLVLDPTGTQTLPTQTITSSIALLIGPEGGLSDREVTLTREYHFQPIKLGPRILRTETATVSALTLLQYQWGDLK